MLKTASGLGEIFANFPDIKKRAFPQGKTLSRKSTNSQHSFFENIFRSASKNSLTGPCSTYTYIISRLCYIVLYIFIRSFTTNTSIKSLINTQLYYGRIHNFISAYHLKNHTFFVCCPKENVVFNFYTTHPGGIYLRF